MPDRKLTAEETEKFKAESNLKHLNFSALHIHLNEKGEPSLYDLCIDELVAAIDALKRIVIRQGIEIRILKERRETHTK